MSAVVRADPEELLGHAVSAFRRGSQALLLSRLECGFWCHQYYLAQAAAGSPDRRKSTKVLAEALAPYAESKRDAKPADLARCWNIASVLGGLKPADLDAGRDALGALTLGKLEALSPLVIRPEGGETYYLFTDDPARQDAARALWAAALDSNVRRQELAERVAALRDPEAHGEGQDAQPVGAPDPAREEPVNPSDQRGQVTGNLLVAASLASSHDLCDLLCGAIQHSADPHEVMERLMSLVAAAPWADQGMKRGAKAALLSLTRRDTTDPVKVEATLAGSAPTGAARRAAV
jgi:hypothetical protein